MQSTAILIEEFIDSLPLSRTENTTPRRSRASSDRVNRRGGRAVVYNSRCGEGDAPLRVASRHGLHIESVDLKRSHIALAVLAYAALVAHLLFIPYAFAPLPFDEALRAFARIPWAQLGSDQNVALASRALMFAPLGALLAMWIAPHAAAADRSSRLRRREPARLSVGDRRQLRAALVSGANGHPEQSCRGIHRRDRRRAAVEHAGCERPDMVAATRDRRQQQREGGAERLRGPCT